MSNAMTLLPVTRYPQLAVPVTRYPQLAAPVPPLMKEADNRGGMTTMARAAFLARGPRQPRVLVIEDTEELR